MIGIFLLLSIIFFLIMSKSTLALLGTASAILSYLAIPWIKQKVMEIKMKKWSNTPKDVVILHTILGGRTIPHPSPFVMKLETYLRMAKIPFKTDISVVDAWGPKGRFPWISLNGVHMGDSELIIQFLKKKFNVQLGKEYSKDEMAVGNAFRVMVDEHMFWGIPMERFVYAPSKRLAEIMSSKLWGWQIWLYHKYFTWQVLSRAGGQGIGKHSQQDVERLIFADVESLSTFLGKKKFLLGDHPSEQDATVFGHVSQLLWGLPGSIYGKTIEKNYHNLYAYAVRMKELYYPDWNDVLAK